MGGIEWGKGRQASAKADQVMAGARAAEAVLSNQLLHCSGGVCGQGDHDGHAGLCRFRTSSSIGNRSDRLGSLILFLHAARAD